MIAGIVELVEIPRPTLLVVEPVGDGIVGVGLLEVVSAGEDTGFVGGTKVVAGERDLEIGGIGGLRMVFFINLPVLGFLIGGILQ